MLDKMPDGGRRFPAAGRYRSPGSFQPFRALHRPDGGAVQVVRQTQPAAISALVQGRHPDSRAVLTARARALTNRATSVLAGPVGVRRYNSPATGGLAETRTARDIARYRLSLTSSGRKERQDRDDQALASNRRLRQTGKAEKAQQIVGRGRAATPTGIRPV